MGFLISLLGGTTLGALGSLGMGILGFFKQNQANKHELEIMAANLEFAKAAGENKISLEAYKTLQGSYETDKETYVNARFPSVDWFRGMVRPALVSLLTLASTILALWAFSRVGIGSILTESIVEHSIQSLYRFTEFSIGWYFGNRQIEKFVIKRRTQ